MWEHVRRWRVGNPAGSGGCLLRVRDWQILYAPDFIPLDFIPPVRILSTQTFRVAGVWILFTQTFLVAGVWILF